MAKKINLKTQIPFIDNKSQLSKINGKITVDSMVTPTFKNGINSTKDYDDTKHSTDNDGREVKRSLMFNVYAFPHSMGITHDSTKAFSKKEILRKTDDVKKSRRRPHYKKRTIRNEIKNTPEFFNADYTKVINMMNNTVFIPNPNDTMNRMMSKYSKFYNRFKVPNLNLLLRYGYAHVFFTRPSCHILKNDKNYSLVDNLKYHQLFSFIHQQDKNILKSLVANNGEDNDFLLMISNYISSFSLNDEVIQTDSYGETYTGYKISFGKNSIESKTANSISIKLMEDRNLSMYKLHKAWVEYINGCSRGEIAPADSSILNKVLDYTASCYFILTAEDNETILFWSKYYGVYPTQIPSSQFNWSSDLVTPREIEMSYQYSFKEDFNPYSILEFNYNSRITDDDAYYVNTFDDYAGHVADTWVKAPFIQFVEDDVTHEIQLKLRFRPRNSSEYPSKDFSMPKNVPNKKVVATNNSKKKKSKNISGYKMVYDANFKKPTKPQKESKPAASPDITNNKSNGATVGATIKLSNKTYESVVTENNNKSKIKATTQQGVSVVNGSAIVVNVDKNKSTKKSEPAVVVPHMTTGKAGTGTGSNAGGGNRLSGVTMVKN